MDGMNTLCHLEYEVTDIARSQQFLEGMFGWTFRQFTPDMVVFGQGDTHIGGLLRVHAVKPGTSPSLWFKVADLDAMVAKANASGGRGEGEKSPVPGVGHSTVVYDPDGNMIGLVQYDA
ncbi:MAG: VOC family protein [Chthonomonas sp.]|nr:VOC family protein [Chthonomonas sp.]